MFTTDEVNHAYDVHGPLPTADAQPPLVMIAHPMDAGGFAVRAAAPTRLVLTEGEEGP